MATGEVLADYLGFSKRFATSLAKNVDNATKNFWIVMYLRNSFCTDVLMSDCTVLLIEYVRKIWTLCD